MSVGTLVRSLPLAGFHILPRIRFYTNADAGALRSINGRQELLRFLGLLALAHALYLFVFFVMGEGMRQYWSLVKPLTFAVVLGCFLLPMRSALLLAIIVAPLNILLVCFYIHQYPSSLSIQGIIRITLENSAMVLVTQFLLNMKDFPWWLALTLGVLTNRLVSTMFLTSAAILDVSRYDSPMRQFLFETVGLMSPCIVLWIIFHLRSRAAIAAEA